jgi:hypothetical protein
MTTPQFTLQPTIQVEHQTFALGKTQSRGRVVGDWMVERYIKRN